MAGAEQWSEPSSDSQRTRSEVTEACAVDANQRSQQPSSRSLQQHDAGLTVSHHESHDSTALVERALLRLHLGLLILEQLAAQVHADLAEVDG